MEDPKNEDVSKESSTPPEKPVPADEPDEPTKADIAGLKGKRLYGEEIPDSSKISSPDSNDLTNEGNNESQEENHTTNQD